MNRHLAAVLLLVVGCGLVGGCAGPQTIGIRPFPSTPRAVSEVQRGWAVAVVGDYPVMAYTARESKGQLEVVGAQFETETFGIGVSKANPDLKAAVTEALRKVMADETYINILRDWAITVSSVDPPAAPAKVLPVGEIAQLADGTLTVGMEMAFAPMEFKDGLGEDAGADVQLAKALAEALGVKVELKNHRFDSLIGEIEIGNVDLIISAMSITGERQEYIDFIPYLEVGSGILVKKGNPDKIQKPQDLCGRTVALQEGTSQIELMRSFRCE